MATGRISIVVMHCPISICVCEMMPVSANRRLFPPFAIHMMFDGRYSSLTSPPPAKL
jgi:hypothetical protein